MRRLCNGNQPFAKHLNKILLSSFVKWPWTFGISLLLIHFNGSHVSCNHTTVHDQEAEYGQRKRRINDKRQEQHSRPAC